MSLIFFLVRWNNSAAFERYLPYEFEDWDTISYNAMLPLLVFFGILERFVKKIGKYPVTKAGFIWSILMIIVPLVIIGITG
jgi:hypothetical protein